MRRKSRNKNLYAATIAIAFLLLVLLVSTVPLTGAAQTTIQDVTVNTAFSCVNGAPAGTVLGNTGTNCFANPNIGYISRILCLFHGIVNEIMGRFYCGIVDAMEVPVMAMITIAVAVFGASFILGIVQFSAREAMIVLLKIALVLGFALNAELALGIGYNLLVVFTAQMTDLFLGAMGVGTGGAIMAEPDGAIRNIGDIMVGQAGVVSGSTIHPACQAFIFKLFMILMIVMPILVLLAVAAFLMYLILFARAAFGYLYSFAMLSFLFALSPIFISFSLFGFSRPLFEHWLSYLKINALQIVLVFAFLSLVVSLDVVREVMQILSMLRPYELEYLMLPMMPFDASLCSFCEYTVNAGGVPVCNDCTTTTDSSGNPVTNCTGTAPAISIFGLGSHGDLIQFVLSRLVAFYMIGWVLEKFLKLAPSIAKELAGDGTSVALGGSPAQLSDVGMKALNPAGIDRVEAGLTGFRDHAMSMKSPMRYKQIASQMAAPRTKIERFTHPLKIISASMGVNAATRAFAGSSGTPPHLKAMSDLRKARMKREKAQGKYEDRQRAFKRVSAKFDAYDKSKKGLADKKTTLSRANDLSYRTQIGYDTAYADFMKTADRFRKGEVDKATYDKAAADIGRKAKHLKKTVSLRDKAQQEYDKELGVFSGILGKFRGDKADKESYNKSKASLDKKGKRLDNTRRLLTKEQSDYDAKYNNFLSVADKFKNGAVSKEIYEAAKIDLDRQKGRLSRAVDMNNKAQNSYNKEYDESLGIAEKIKNNKTDKKNYDKKKVEAERRGQYFDNAYKQENHAREARESSFLEGKRRKRSGFIARRYEEKYGQDYRYASDIWNAARLGWAQEMHASRGMKQSKIPRNMQELRRNSSIIDKWYSRLVRNRGVFSSYTSDVYDPRAEAIAKRKKEEEVRKEKEETEDKLRDDKRKDEDLREKARREEEDKLRGE